MEESLHRITSYNVCYTKLLRNATNGWMHAQNSAAGRVSDETREAGLICTFSALVLKSRSAHIFRNNFV